MQLKLRHLLLFLISCIVLIFSDFAGAYLLALLSLFQLLFLLHSIKPTKSLQFAALRLFLLSWPLMFLWGGVFTMLQIYIAEQSYLFLSMAAVLSFLITVLINLQTIHIYRYLSAENTTVTKALSLTYQNIKNIRFELLKSSIILYLLCFIPLSTEPEWRIIFSITVSTLILNWAKLKSEALSF